MCKPRTAAHRKVSRSPEFAPFGPPLARRIIPKRLKTTTTRTHHENLTPKMRRSARGAKTTKSLVMSPEFVGLVRSRPVV
jgi:hypothetical protein